MSHVLVAYTDDEPGVLNRVASLFRRRAFNIHSLTVGPTERPGVSRMTLVVDTDDQGAVRAQANLEKLLNVQRVENLSARPSVVRDLVLLRVAAEPAVRAELIQLAQAFRASVVDIAPNSLVLECTGSSGKIDALLDVMKPYGILEMGRTGVVAMSRGAEFYGARSAHTASEALAVNFQ
ncbi:MAG TPA: acetolactate synthase small subunit [Holophaga sp.]|nr:acetolactate synthase small subunit [Holophaga sp.]